MKKNTYKKTKGSSEKIRKSMRRINKEINTLLHNLSRSAAIQAASKKQDLFSNKIIESIKEEGLCQNIFFLQDALARETVDKKINLAAESIASWVFTTFEIKKKFIEGEVLQISKSELDKFIIPDHFSEPFPPTISVRITQPGFQYKGAEIAKPLVEILK